MKWILILLFSFLPLFSVGQYYYLYGDKTFGGNNTEISQSIILGTEQNLIISGSSYSDLSGNKTVPLCNPTLSGQQDGWILTIDTAFNVLWQNDIGGDNSEDRINISNSNIQSQILVSCRSNSDSSCNKSENNKGFPLIDADYWVEVLDSTGTKLWDKTYGSLVGDFGSKMVKLSTNDYIICGTTGGAIGGDKTVSNFGSSDFWLVKIDSIGNKIWDKVYGGNGNEISGGAGYTGIDYDIQTNIDGTFILGGTTTSPISGTISDSSRGGSDFWIIKIDTAGNKVWDKRFGGDQNDNLYDINSTNDGGYLLCGFTNSSLSGDVSEPSLGNKDFWIVKVDSLGNKQWDKRFGGIGEEVAGHIEHDFDGGYWIGGKLTSGMGGDVSEPSFGSVDYWILKLDSLGNKIWDKRFGGPGDNILTSFQVLADSSIMLFGLADSGTSFVKTSMGYGQSDYWLVHFYYGNNPPVGITENINANDILIYPNPSTTEIIISVNSKGKSTVEISDITGKIIGQYCFSETISIDTRALNNGVYICQIYDEQNLFVRKFLKL